MVNGQPVGDEALTRKMIENGDPEPQGDKLTGERLDEEVHALGTEPDENEDEEAEDDGDFEDGEEVEEEEE